MSCCRLRFSQLQKRVCGGQDGEEKSISSVFLMMYGLHMIHVSFIKDKETNTKRRVKERGDSGERSYSGKGDQDPHCSIRMGQEKRERKRQAFHVTSCDESEPIKVNVSGLIDCLSIPSCLCV